MAGSYKLVVKNGDSKYKFNDGKYDYKTIDYVEEFETLGEALSEFLTWTNDPDAEDKVSLVFLPAKKSKVK